MKTTVVDDGPSRTVVVVLAAGDAMPEALETACRELDVTAARVEGIGAFSRATVAFFDLESRDYLPIPVEEQVEVVSIAGNVSTVASSGERRIHLHALLSRRDGSTVGGHLLDATVRPTLELFLTESPVPLRRVTDEATGLPLLDLDR